MVRVKNFDGVKWAEKKGIYKNSYKRKKYLTERSLKNKVVLDAGCGSGMLTNYFSTITKEIYGIDINENDIKEANKKYSAENLFFRVGDIQEIPFCDSTFDMIYSLCVIEHLTNPKRFINEAYRVLKPDGILILWVPNILSIEGLITKVVPLSLKVQLLEILRQSSEVSHRKCYYRANSVRNLDILCSGKFKRIYLERFDEIGYFKKIRFLSYFWLLKHKIANNKLLDWTHQHFYVEYKKCV